jgi:hypothetical protein
MFSQNKMEHKLHEYSNSTNEAKMLYATPKDISVIRAIRDEFFGFGRRFIWLNYYQFSI